MYLNELSSIAAAGAMRRRLDGLGLLDLLKAAATALTDATRRLDDLNVYPVPDGDTGTNLRLTFAAALDEAQRAHGAGFSDVAKAAARGALRVARGNSGVMLSQWLSVLAAAVGEAPTVGGATLARALDAAGDGARAAVQSPVEGTILTAMRQAADRALVGPGGPARRLHLAAEGAGQATLESPGRLPLLAEAGVVDAGALGFAVILRAMAARVSGREASVFPPGIEAASPASRWRDSVYATTGGAGGYVCLQLSIAGSTINRDALRLALEGQGDSLLVAGDGDLARVHVHTRDVASALAIAARFGETKDIAETEIDAASQRFLRPVPRTAIVAVVEGGGWRRLYAEFGATVVEPGALEGHVAAGLHAERVIVIDTGSAFLPESVVRLPVADAAAGLAALLAFDRDEDLETNLDSMRAAAAGVATFVVQDPDEAESIVAGVEAVAGLVTVYFGSSVDEDRARSLAARLRTRRPGLTVEVVSGGQTEPSYLLSLEA